MKLVYYTYRKISLLLFVLMAVWGVLFIMPLLMRLLMKRTIRWKLCRNINRTRTPRSFPS